MATYVRREGEFDAEQFTPNELVPGAELTSAGVPVVNPVIESIAGRVMLRKDDWIVKDEAGNLVVLSKPAFDLLFQKKEQAASGRWLRVGIFVFAAIPAILVSVAFTAFLGFLGASVASKGNIYWGIVGAVLGGVIGCFVSIAVAQEAKKGKKS